MKTNPQIRQEALSLMKGNWGTAVCITLIASVISYVCSAIYYIPAIFVSYPLSVGIMMAYLHHVRGTQKLSIEAMFSTFNAKYYWKSVGLMLLTSIYIFLWLPRHRWQHIASAILSRFPIPNYSGADFLIYVL